MIDSVYPVAVSSSISLDLRNPLKDLVAGTTEGRRKQFGRNASYGREGIVFWQKSFVWYGLLGRCHFGSNVLYGMACWEGIITFWQK